MNKVIAGDLLKSSVRVTPKGKPYISSPPLELMLDSSHVSNYEVIDSSSKISTSDAINRALVGSLFLGAPGLAAGLGAKKKGTFHIAVQFKNGWASLLEVDTKVYNAITKSLFSIRSELSASKSNVPQNQVQASAPISIADEIKKYKDLLDSGALTEEEFSQLKNDLINARPLEPVSHQQNAPATDMCQQDEAEPVNLLPKMQTLKITRRPRFLSGGAGYHILVDGTFRDNIDNGETVSIQCTGGNHTITFSLPKEKYYKKPLGSIEIFADVDAGEMEIELVTKSQSRVSATVLTHEPPQ